MALRSGGDQRMLERKTHGCPLRHENGNCLPIGGFCTAVQDEICFALRNAYENGKFDGMREALIPRVMPLTNVMEWMGEIDELRDPVYWENRFEKCENQWLLEAMNPLYMINAIKAGRARVWTQKPTEEQSKAVKWDG